LHALDTHRKRRILLCSRSTKPAFSTALPTFKCRSVCLHARKADARALSFGFTAPIPVESRVRSAAVFPVVRVDIMSDYMNGFKCNVTNPTSNVPLAKAQVPRRCGADPANNVPNPTPGNCTYGAKQPFYWFQAEQNNVCCHFGLRLSCRD
jgi:hypothetical protein